MQTDKKPACIYFYKIIQVVTGYVVYAEKESFNINGYDGSIIFASGSNG